MLKIKRPFPIKDLFLDPELKQSLEVDEKIQQTLAAMLGWDGESRRLLTCGVGGALHSMSPTAIGVTNSVSSGADEDITYGDIPTSEVMVRANALNTSWLWVNVGAVGGVDIGWPLSPGETITLSLNNMNQLNVNVVTSGDKAIVLRTV